MALLQASAGVEFVMRPYNNSVAVGENVTMACLVRNVGNSDRVQWKKYSTSGQTWMALTIDSVVVDDDKKYAIVNPFNLTVMNTVIADATDYECAVTGLETAVAHLSVVNLPRNVSIFTKESPKSGKTVNFTCKATYGQPPPSIRWYKNQVDYTNRADYETGYININGYGDATSVLPLALTSGDQGADLRCEIEYPGWPRAIIENHRIQLNGSSALKVNLLLAMIVTVVTFLFRA
ncbi:hypothetical protein ScPMuIL_001103 [Solemya velum]